MQKITDYDESFLKVFLELHYTNIDSFKIQKPKSKLSEVFNFAILKRNIFESYKTLKWINYDSLKKIFELEYLKNYGLSSISTYDKTYVKLWSEFINSFNRIVICFNNTDVKEQILFL